MRMVVVNGGLFLLSQIINVMRYILVFSWWGKLKSELTIIKRVVCFIIWLIVIVFFNCVFANKIEPVMMVTLIFFLIAIYNTNRKNVIRLFIPTYIIFSFVDEVVAMGLGMVFSFNPLVVVEKNGKLLEIVIEIITVILILFIYRHIKVDLFSGIHVFEYIMLCITLLCINLLLSIVTFCLFSEQEVWSKYYLIIIVLSVLSVACVTVMVGYLRVVIEKRRQQDEKIKMYVELNKMQVRYYQLLYEKNDEIRKFRHDFHHHITFVKRCIEEKQDEKALNYIKDLIGIDDGFRSEKRSFSGNYVVDSIIYGTVLQSEEDILFHYTGKLREYIGISDIDLITLLSNALENAVEACKKCEGKKEITMRVESYKDNFRFIIKNTYVKKDEVSGQERYTTKDNKENHGYGRINMRKIVEKYDGMLEERKQENEYILIIQLNEK